MKTAEEFRKYYEAELLPKLTELENIRKKTIARGNLFLLIIMLLFIAACGYFKLTTTTIILLLLCPIGWYIFILLCYFAYFNKYWIKFKYEFKKEVIGGIVKFIDQNLKYTQNGDTRRHEFKQRFIGSKLYTNALISVFVEDIVEGEINGVHIEFAEVNNDNSPHPQQNIGPNHILFIADFNKKFSEEVFILPDSFKESVAKGFNRLIPLYNKLVKLEDPEFEKLFRVYGNNQIEARYILSTGLMCKITELRKKFNCPLAVSFADSKISIFIYKIKRFFEPRIFSPVINYEKTYDYFDTLQSFIGIVEELNLNRRIWNKSDNEEK